MKSPDFPFLNFVTPRSFTKGRKSGQPSVIVFHTTEGHEKVTSAEDGASYDARRTDGTSTHFFVDSNTVVQCVRIEDEAHAARQHGNDIGVHIEICGRAGQTIEQWEDNASLNTLVNVAKLCVMLRRKYPGRFPLTRLNPAMVRAGQHGFCGHVDITRAFPEDNGTHTDPGKNFPWTFIFGEIRRLETPPTPLPPRSTGMELTTVLKQPDGSFDTQGYEGRRIGHVFADLHEERNWLYANDDGSDDDTLVTPPSANSRIVKHYQRIKDIEGILIDIQKSLGDTPST